MSTCTFSCIDCNKSFKNDGEYRTHTTCITEVQKYEKKKVVNRAAASTDALNKPVGSATDVTGEAKSSKDLHSKKRKSEVKDVTHDKDEEAVVKESSKSDKEESREGRRDKESSKGHKHGRSKSEHKEVREPAKENLARSSNKKSADKWK